MSARCQDRTPALQQATRMAWAYRTSSVGGASRLSGPCRLQVADELEFGRLHDRQVGRLCAFEDRCHTERDDTSADYRPHSSSASLASLANGIDSGYLMARRERRKLDAAADSHMDE